MLPTHFRLELAIRKNVLELEPYVCARDEYKVGVLLDANENSLGHALPATSAAVDGPSFLLFTRKLLID